MAGERRLDGDLRRFKITDFADHDDIGVLTQKRSQATREVETDFVADLHLVDPHDAVFDRVFGRGNVYVRFVELRERGVQGRRFTTAGRTGDEDHSVRAIDRFFEVFDILRVEAEL